MKDKHLLVLIFLGWITTIFAVGHFTGCMIPTEPDCINYDCENACWRSAWIYNNTLEQWYWRQWEIPCE